MELAQVLVMIVPMLVGLGSVIGVLAWTRRRRTAGRRSPLTQGLLRPAGHRLSTEFNDAFVDIMAWVMGATFIPAMLGAMYSITLQRPGGWNAATALVYMAPAAIATLLCVYKVFAIHRKAMDIRMGWDGELAAGQELDQLMRRGGIVFHDLPASKFNIDHVLVCSAGVFAVETKSRMKPVRDNRAEARVVFDGAVLQFPDWHDSDSIHQARRQAKWLAKELSGAVGEPIAVSPVVALPGWFVERKERSDVWVLNPKEFSYLLEPKGATLSPEMVKRVAYQVEQRCRDVAPAYSE